MAVLELLRILHKSHLQMIPALPEFYLWFKLRSRCLIMAENRKLQRTQKTETKTDPKKSSLLTSTVANEDELYFYQRVSNKYKVTE